MGLRNLHVVLGKKKKSLQWTLMLDQLGDYWALSPLDHKQVARSEVSAQRSKCTYVLSVFTQVCTFFCLIWGRSESTNFWVFENQRENNECELIGDKLKHAICNKIRINSPNGIMLPRQLPKVSLSASVEHGPWRGSIILHRCALREPGKRRDRVFNNKGPRVVE